MGGTRHHQVLCQNVCGRVRGRAERHEWNLCGCLWWPSFLWLIFTGLGGMAPSAPLDPLVIQIFTWCDVTVVSPWLKLWQYCAIKWCSSSLQHIKKWTLHYHLHYVVLYTFTSKNWFFLQSFYIFDQKVVAKMNTNDYLRIWSRTMLSLLYFC